MLPDLFLGQLDDGLADAKGDVLYDLEILPAHEVDSGEPLFKGGSHGDEYGGVVEVGLGAHDGVRACNLEAGFDVGVVEDVPVGKDNGVRREVVAQVSDEGPISQAGVVTLLVSPAAVNGKDAGTGVEDHLGVDESIFLGVENPDFGGDGDVEFIVEGVYELADEVGLLL